MIHHLFHLLPNLQYFGEDCKALVVSIGAGMNLLSILVDSNKKARIGTLFLSDLERIMAFLSDDGTGRLLEWIQSAGSFTFSDESVTQWTKNGFEPR
jgi:hypothetical protein